MSALTVFASSKCPCGKPIVSWGNLTKLCFLCYFRYENVLTAVKHPLQSWTELQEFIFSDGTTDEPQPPRDIDENNYLPSGAHIFGLTMMSVSILLSGVAAGWTYVYRSSRLLRAAQPAFLYVICFGSIMSALAIFTSSFDESYGWDEESLSTACMASIWMYVLGYITVYCALFSKVSCFFWCALCTPLSFLLTCPNFHFL